MDRLAFTSVRPDRERAQLIVAGTLDAWGAGELERHLAGLVDAGARHVTVDLSRVLRWDARGTDVLTDTCLRLWDWGSLSVRGQQPHMLSGVDLPDLGDPTQGITNAVGSASMVRTGRTLIDTF